MYVSPPLLTGYLLSETYLVFPSSCSSRQFRFTRSLTRYLSTYNSKDPKRPLTPSSSARNPRLKREMLLFVARRRSLCRMSHQQNHICLLLRSPCLSLHVLPQTHYSQSPLRLPSNPILPYLGMWTPRGASPLFGFISCVKSW